eukprot:scaffold10005_cov167-Isochrysis_galbana.AAC.1
MTASDISNIAGAALSPCHGQGEDKGAKPNTSEKETSVHGAVADTRPTTLGQDITYYACA